MKLFVYGSLMSGFWNFDKYLKDITIDINPAKIKGRLFHLKDRGYPALINGELDIIGEIITIDESNPLSITKLNEIDVMEGYIGQGNINNEYNKEKRLVVNLNNNKDEVLDVFIFNTENPNFNFDEFVEVTNQNWRYFMNDK